MARGREAETPMEIPAPGWKDILFRVKDEIAADHVSLVAAASGAFGSSIRAHADARPSERERKGEGLVVERERE